MAAVSAHESAHESRPEQKCWSQYDGGAPEPAEVEAGGSRAPYGPPGEPFCPLLMKYGKPPPADR